jgi:hypothetical protein
MSRVPSPLALNAESTVVGVHVIMDHPFETRTRPTNPHHTPPQSYPTPLVVSLLLVGPTVRPVSEGMRNTFVGPLFRLMIGRVFGYRLV